MPKIKNYSYDREGKKRRGECYVYNCSEKATMKIMIKLTTPLLETVEFLCCEKHGNEFPEQHEISKEA